METNTSNSDNKAILFLLLGCSFSIITFIGGLIIGLVVLGWWLWPVQWVDTTPTDLRHEYQLIYVDMVVDTFKENHGLTQARYRLHPWNDTEALQLLNETFDIAKSEGATPRAEAIQILIDSYETAIP